MFPRLVRLELISAYVSNMTLDPQFLVLDVNGLSLYPSSRAALDTLRISIGPVRRILELHLYLPCFLLSSRGLSGTRDGPGLSFSARLFWWLESLSMLFPSLRVLRLYLPPTALPIRNHYSMVTLTVEDYVEHATKLKQRLSEALGSPLDENNDQDRVVANDQVSFSFRIELYGMPRHLDVVPDVVFERVGSRASMPRSTSTYAARCKRSKSCVRRFFLTGSSFFAKKLKQKGFLARLKCLINKCLRNHFYSRKSYLFSLYFTGPSQPPYAILERRHHVWIVVHDCLLIHIVQYHGMESQLSRQ